jgi:hypothetical protein
LKQILFDFCQDSQKWIELVLFELSQTERFGWKSSIRERGWHFHNWDVENHKSRKPLTVDRSWTEKPLLAAVNQTRRGGSQVPNDRSF